MQLKEKHNLITRNLQEIIGDEELKKILSSKKPLSIYWGTMTTGSPQLAYFFPLLKIRDFLKADSKVTILIADLHAALDGVDWKILKKREKYYASLIKEMLKILKVSSKNLKFVKGSTFQLSKKYSEDLLKLSMLCNIKECKKAASEVVKMTENPKLGNLIYPIMQSLDEEYLKVDAQFGGLDQRKLLVFARENLPKLGYKPRIELMNPMIRGLVGEKMSSSIPSSKIDLLDDEQTVNKKINNAECLSGNTNNFMLQFLKFIYFPLNEKNPLIIKRPEKFGGNISYKKYQDLENDFAAKKLHPADLKKATAREINKLLAPIRKNKQLHKLYKEAYD